MKRAFAQHERLVEADAGELIAIGAQAEKLDAGDATPVSIELIDV